MRFGRAQVRDCAGAVLAHSVQAGGTRLRKGVVLSEGDLDLLSAAGIHEITVAQLDPGDVSEDLAAAELARALIGITTDLRVGPAGTGRCNIFATGPGLAQINAAAIDAANAVHPMITVATVPPLARMAQDGMVATVKIISYAVPRADLERACTQATGALSFAWPRRRAVTLLETQLDGVTLSNKGAEAVAGRVKALGGALNIEERCAHSADALTPLIAQAQGDLILILTASATSDVADTAPQALVQAGGTLTHFGMPVDPGNLLFIGARADGTPVIGLPGCARSPALNGADWVLERVMCGIDVSAKDIMGMGVGGLLKEIPTRPQPRTKTDVQGGSPRPAAPE